MKAKGIESYVLREYRASDLERKKERKNSKARGEGQLTKTLPVTKTIMSSVVSP